MFNTAFKKTVNSFNSWPKLYVDNTDDLSQVNEYQEPYVWLIHKDAKVIENFNWNYRPEFENKLKVHLFPKVLPANKSPIKWNRVKLVPTSIHRHKDNIRTRIISEYASNQFPLIVYSTSKDRIVKKFQKFEQAYNFQLLKGQTNLNETLKKYNPYIKETHIWFIDIDVELDTDWEFSFDVEDGYQEDTIYEFKTIQKSVNKAVHNNTVMLFPKAYLYKIQGRHDMIYKKLYEQGERNLYNRLPELKKMLEEQKYKTKKIDQVVGTLNDISDPQTAWIRSCQFAKKFNITTTMLKNAQKQDMWRYIEHAYQKQSEIDDKTIFDQQEMEKQFKIRQQEKTKTLAEQYNEEIANLNSELQTTIKMSPTN